MMFASLLLAAATSIYDAPRLPIRDAVIRADAPESNSGRDFILPVGAGKALLFDSQMPRLTLPAGEEAASATLTYQVKEGSPKVTSIRLIKRPWQEGKGWQGNSGDPGRGVTWRSSISGSSGAKWTAPGGTGPEDSQPIEGWQAEVKAGKLVITGLAASLNQVLRDPSRSFGWRIEFEGEGQLVSAESTEQGPELEITNQAAQGIRQVVVGPLLPQGTEKPPLAGPWSGRIVNQGTSPAPGLKAVWSVGDRVISSQDLALNPGEAKDVSATLNGKASFDSPEASLVSLRIEGPDGSVGQVCHPWGISVAGDPDSLGRVVDHLNTWILPFSRFSFAEEGVGERFRVAGPNEKPEVVLASDKPLSIIEAARQTLVASANWGGPILRPGYGLTQDTRDERLGVPGVPLSALGWGSRLADNATDPPSGLLGRYEAGRLHQLVGVRGEARQAWKPLLPGSLVLRCFDLSGRPLNEVDLEARVVALGAASLISDAPKASWKGKTMNSGGVFLNPPAFAPSRQALVTGPDEALELVFGRPDSQQVVRLTYADLVAEGLRGMAAAASMEVRIPAVDADVDLAQNLAEAKVIEDSLGRFPAQLSALIDGRPETSVEMPGAEGGWIEIDLGRERQVGQIELEFEGPAWRSFSIAFYGTSQSPANAQNWIQERESSLRLVGGKATYRGSLSLMRYIRILPLSGGSAKLREVAVRAGTPVAPPAKSGTLVKPPR